MRRTSLRSVWTAMRWDLPFLGLVGAYVGLGFLVGNVLGYIRPFRPQAPWALLFGFGLFYGIAAFLAATTHAVVVEKRSLLVLATWRSVVVGVAEPRRLVPFVLLMAALPVLMQVFIRFKEAIPVFQPFVWDQTFMLWDRWLHFGRHPYEWLQPLLGHPRATRSIDFVYFLWIPLMYFTFIWQAWHGKNERVRAQYLLAFGLCWVLVGTGLAIALSSAGPVYYQDVVGRPDPYQPLLTYLSEVDSQHELRALRFQAMLWDSYTNPEAGGAGISAMPSMHVTIAVLMALLGFATNRTLGWAYTAFAFLVMLGSVHLAWHYAIDGYFGALCAVGIWWFSGRVLDADAT